MKILVFDIGGTAIKYGICKDGILMSSAEAPTNAKNGGRFVIDTVIRLAKEIFDSTEESSLESFDGIGISTAGQVNVDNGSIIYGNSNIPGYIGMEIRKELENVFHLPVMVENDVNCAAIGEATYGAGKDFDSFLCLTYGTGIGGAIIENKEIYHGSTFSAGEFGAIITHGEVRYSNIQQSGTDANTTEKDYFKGCYEQYASVTALVKRACAYNAALTNGRTIFEHLNDTQVLNILNSWVDEITLGLITLIHIFNPACIVLGGGIMTQPYILNILNEKIYSEIMPSFSQVKIVTAQLGNHAGLYGIYHLTCEYCKTN